MKKCTNLYLRISVFGSICHQFSLIRYMVCLHIEALVNCTSGHVSAYQAHRLGYMLTTRPILPSRHEL